MHNLFRITFSTGQTFIAYSKASLESFAYTLDYNSRKGNPIRPLHEAYNTASSHSIILIGQSSNPRLEKRNIISRENSILNIKF
jgi:hypothetical protein